MPTLIECKSIEENMGLCKGLGLCFIELNMNLPQYQVEKIDDNLYRSLMKEYGIFFTLHLPEELNISDFNPRVRKAYLDTVCDSIILAKKIGISIINMHMISGVYFTLPDRKVYLFNEYLEYYLDSIKDFGNAVSELIKGENIYICIENIGIYNREYIRKAIVELLKYKCFKLTWDIGHDYSSGVNDTNFILENKKHIKHFHIHDAIGEKNHLPIGTGEIDVGNKLRIAKDNGCLCVIETKTISGLRKSVEAFERGHYSV